MYIFLYYHIFSAKRWDFSFPIILRIQICLIQQIKILAKITLEENNRFITKFNKTDLHISLILEKPCLIAKYIWSLQTYI